MSTKEFTCQSTAPPLEKARRVLQSLADPKGGTYFFDDGFPRWSALHRDTAAALAVFNELAAENERLKASAPAAAQPLSVEQINEGLRLHRLAVDTPSQLADSFRAGARWADRARGIGAAAPAVEQP